MHFFWRCLVADQEAYCQSTLDELVHALKICQPGLPPVVPQQLPTAKNELLHSCLKAIGDDFWMSHPLTYYRVFVFCGYDEEYVAAIKLREPGAQWGAAIEDHWALAWTRDNKYLLWHETLHLLCAKDCYDKVSYARTCTEPRCIMQYVPTAENCGAGFHLCEENVQRIRDRGVAGTTCYPVREAIGEQREREV